MPVPRRHRLGLTALALLTGSVTLPSPAAQALPVFTETKFIGAAHAGTMDTATCTVSQTKTGPVVISPMAENGAPSRATATTTGTLTRNGDNGDVISFSARHEGAASVESAGGDPTRLDLAMSGTVEASTSNPVAGCELSLYSPFELDLGFTVARAGFLDVTLAAGAHTLSHFYLEDVDDPDTYFEFEGNGPGFADLSTIHLPPGQYRAYLFVRGIVRTTTTVPPTSIQASVHADFAPAGSRAAGPVGKATRYVDLPDARSCDTDSLDATMTANRKRVKKVKQVKVFVNDQLVKKVRTPRRGQLVKAQIADEAAADVRVEVTLKATKPGRPGKSYEATASYLACA